MLSWSYNSSQKKIICGWYFVLILFLGLGLNKMKNMQVHFWMMEETSDQGAICSSVVVKCVLITTFGLTTEKGSDITLELVFFSFVK